MMEIVKGTIEDIELLYPIAANFYSSSKFLNGFMPVVFKQSWTTFLSSGLGVLFLLKNDNGIHGMLGGMKYPDPNSGELIATEFFWFVNPEKRGQGLKLLKAFESWAKEQECKKIIMVHLADLMPDRIKQIYEKSGYEMLETHYVKEV